MKLFHAQDTCYTFSAFVIDRIPILSTDAEADDRGELLARTLVEDACYLSADGSDQIALEMIRLATGRPGRPIVHLLAIRCRDRNQRSCNIRHEACEQGMKTALQQNGYQLHEITFEDYLACTRTAGREVVWGIAKAALQERGLQGSYASVPIVEDVDWERIYSALDGSGCSFSVQIIPALATAAERSVIRQNYTKTSQAAEGALANIRDPIAEDVRQRWRVLSEQVNSPMASVHITVQGPSASAALVCARIQQAIRSGPFSVTAIAGYEELTVFDRPWKLCALGNSRGQLPFAKWTCAEAAKLQAFPAQRNVFTGVPGNPFSLLPETELVPGVLTQCGSGQIRLGKTIGSDQPVALPPELFLLHTGIFGKSGVGKTTLLKQLIRHFAAKNIPVLILEPVKREYRGLVREQETAKVFTVESPAMPLLINPFRVPAGVRLGEYRSSLLSAFKAAFSMPDPLPALFEKAITEAYLQYGWTDQSCSADNNVTVFDTAQFIRVFQRVIRASSYSAEVKGNMMAGGAFRLQSLIERCPRTFDTVHSTDAADLLRGTVVLEMGKLEPEQKALVSSLTLISILAYLKATRESAAVLRNIILIDEAHALLDQGDGATVEEKALNSTMNQLLVNLVTEIRAYGVGIIFSDQSPSRIGEKLLDNVDNVIAFRLTGKEAEMLQTHIGAEEDLARCLPLLSTGEMVLSNHHLHQPLALRAHSPVPGRDTAAVSDSDLVRCQQKYLAAHAGQYCPYSQCRGAGCSACSFAVREEANKYSAQLYAARREKLMDPSQLAAHLVKLPEALAAQGCSPAQKNFRKLCACTAVHLIRRCAMEGGIALTENAAAQLLKEVEKQINLIRKESSA